MNEKNIVILRNIFNMRTKIYILLLIALTVTSCGEYDALLKSTDNELKKQKVYEYYDAGKYMKVTELLTQILPRYRATEEAEQLNWINAQATYKLLDFEIAEQYFKDFAELYPISNNAEEALYMAAMCNYNLSPRAELDQAYTNKAIESFTIFMTRFPNSTRNEDCKVKKKEMQEKLVEKSYISSRLYYDMGEFRAATVSLSNSLKEYPDTKYREELMFLKLDALFQTAQRSIPSKQRDRFQSTLDEYYSFIEEYPKSEHEKDVAKIYATTAKFLKIENVTN
jgi:outer membrane protein assembly factor BamD